MFSLTIKKDMENLLVSLNNLGVTKAFMIIVCQSFEKCCLLTRYFALYLSRFPIETSVNVLLLINITLFFCSQFV